MENKIRSRFLSEFSSLMPLQEITMKRLLVLVPLAVLAIAAPAEAQSQTGGLPVVSEEVKTLQTQVQTQQTEMKALQTQVDNLESQNAALQSALSKEAEARQAGDAQVQQALAQEVQQAVTQEAQARAQAEAQIQQALTQEVQKREQSVAQVQDGLTEEAQTRLNADTNLAAKLDVFGGVDILSAQFEVAGAGDQATNEFGLVLREIVGPGSWIAIATISDLRGDVLGGRPASRECELRNGPGDFLGGAAASNHDADGVALVVTGGLFVESGGGEIDLWCRVTNSDFGASWDGAQMVTLKIAGFRED